MRECQLCGVKSWGHVTVSGVDFMAGHPLFRQASIDRYVQCDGCGTLAARVIIEKPAPEPADAQFPLGLICGETRLERLVIAFASCFRELPLPASVVQFARAVEAELDQQAKPSPGIGHGG